MSVYPYRYLYVYPVYMCICRKTMTDYNNKNDLYANLGDELTNGNGKSLGTLQRVRAAYDFCEFETASGKTVKRDVSDVLGFVNGAYSFN